MVLGAIGKAIGGMAKSAGKTVGKGVENLKSMDAADKMGLVEKIGEAAGSIGSSDSDSGSDLHPMIKSMMQPMDTGFYGHMQPKGWKKAPTIKGGINACKSKGRK